MLDFYNQKALNKKFITLLFDSIEFLDIYERNINESNSLIRSSIISSILLLECSANCCIYSLDFNKQLFEEFDKMTIISKFELFSLNKINKNIDRSFNHFEIIKELIKIRNDYVHPKIIEGNFINSENGINSEYGNYKSLKISKDIRIWNLDDAKKVINSIIKFLNYFFIDLCKIEAGEVSNILGCSEEKLSIKKVHIYLTISDDSYNKLNRFIIEKIKFIDIKIFEKKAP